jgi:hypothetical protein
LEVRQNVFGVNVLQIARGGDDPERRDLSFACHFIRDVAIRHLVGAVVVIVVEIESVEIDHLAVDFAL